MLVELVLVTRRGIRRDGEAGAAPVVGDVADVAVGEGGHGEGIAVGGGDGFLGIMPRDGEDGGHLHGEDGAGGLGDGEETFPAEAGEGGLVFVAAIKEVMRVLDGGGAIHRTGEDPRIRRVGVHPEVGRNQLRVAEPDAFGVPVGRGDGTRQTALVLLGVGDQSHGNLAKVGRALALHGQRPDRRHGRHHAGDQHDDDRHRHEQLHEGESRRAFRDRSVGE